MGWVVRVLVAEERGVFVSEFLGEFGFRRRRWRRVGVLRIIIRK